MKPSLIARARDCLPGKKHFSLGLVLTLVLGASAQTATPRLPQAHGWVKTTSEMSPVERFTPPLDPAMVFSRPGQLAILPLVPQSAIEALKQQSALESDRRLQIGLNRTLENPMIVNRFTTRSAEWTLMTNGWRMLAAQVASAGAVGMRLHFEKVSLPSGAQILIYDPARPTAANIVLDSQSFGTAPDLWTPTLFAEQAGIECQLPPGVDPVKVAFTISAVSHIYTAPVHPSFLKDGSCENDVTCYPDYNQQAAGVALISYVHGGNTYLCNGCLLATTHHTSAEYFLTARHCIGNPTAASTLEFYWLFQTRECNGAPPELTSVPKTTSGADFLATGISDFTLVRLRRPAPAGAYFLGWSVNRPNYGDGVVGIHHPDGGYKRISFGSFIGSDIYYWGVGWSSGVTEPGSSGSPLFNSDHQVIGQLTGGWDGPGSSCVNPGAPDQYGRFDVTYPYIKKFIDPSGSSGGPPPVAGTFYGLFYDQSTGVIPGSSGALTVTTTAKGKLTGKVQMAASSYAFTGQLDMHGVAIITVNRRDLGPLAVQLQINIDQGSDTLTGLLSDGTWTATLNGDRAVFDGKTASSVQTGRHTLIIRPNSDAGPGGDSYGTCVVDKTGRLTFVSSLSDGTRVTQSTFVSRNGQSPLYVSLYSGQGYLFTWLTFSSTDTSDLTSQVYWNNSKLGFSVVSDLNGSVYNPPVFGGTNLNFTDATLTLRGGGLSQDLQGRVQMRSDGRLTSSSSLRVTLSFASQTGIFKGSLTDPATKRSLHVHGVALQKQNLAAGYFTNRNQSGEVLIQP